MGDESASSNQSPRNLSILLCNVFAGNTCDARHGGRVFPHRAPQGDNDRFDKLDSTCQMAFNLYWSMREYFLQRIDDFQAGLRLARQGS